MKRRQTRVAGQRRERDVFVQVPGCECQDGLHLFQRRCHAPYESNPDATADA